MKVFVAVFICMLIVREARVQYLECRNPNQRMGRCININLCPALVSVLKKSSLTDSERQFVQQSRCEYDRNDPVFACCTQDTDFVRTSAAISVAEPSNLLPDQYSCGGDIVSPKVLNGQEAVPSEFSWMVLLEYRPPNGGELRTNCSGSLINRRYVLSAAHCLYEYHLRQVGTLVSVRLGEHDTRTAEDCQGRKCYSEVLRMAIEEKHIHEDYVGGSNNLNDIGILRLASMVSYTPTIRPICLPSTVGRVRMQDGDRLTVAGWGRTLDEISSPTKQKVLVPLWKYDKCRKIYLSAKIAVGPSQICAGGEDLVDSCNGDSGGPLMSFHKGVWVLQGIVSFGYRCGAKNWPAIYTNVSVYDSWIREKMRP